MARWKVMSTARVHCLLIAACAAALGVAGLSWLGPGRDPFRLPADMRLEETVADLSARFAADAVVEQRADDPVRIGWLAPGFGLSIGGARRRAIVAPPPAHLRFRVRVPVGARLALGMGVERRGTRGRAPVGVRFTVEADGHRLLSRTIDPGRRRRDRQWLDARIGLGTTTEREIEVGLVTEPMSPGAQTAVVGWSHVRVVRELRHARQPAAPGAASVLLLLVDTLRAGDLGCYGAMPSPSPTLDGLAAAGRLFEQAVASAPWTLPSVATLFTGLPPSGHGVTGARPREAADVETSALGDTLPTLAETAARAGITTVGVTTNALVSRSTNLARGFETFVELDWTPERRRWATAAEVNASFLRWLRRNRSRRFFAYLHYMDVHDPYTPPEPLRPPPPPHVRPDIAAGRLVPLALRVNAREAPPLPVAEIDYLHALYRGEIGAWDDALRHLLEGLGQIGVLDSTVLVVTADHGEEFQEHGMLSHRAQLYEESIRVPLVIAGPSVTPGRLAAQAAGIDLFPTIAALLGLPLPPDLRGQNLLDTPVSRPAFSETRQGSIDRAETPLFSVRLPGWKLIHAPVLQRYQLYDLTRDPGEREDRFGAAPEGERLAALLADWRAATLPPPQAERGDPRLEEKLRRLGYVE
jgi:arylsulfatase A-like enzyme